MTYTPSPEDLEPERMSPELRRIADGVLPFNRERFEEARAEFNEGMRRVLIALSASVQPALAAFRRFNAQLARMDYVAHGRTRPNGRPRRTGRRHRGMPAWRRRHG